MSECKGESSWQFWRPESQQHGPTKGNALLHLLVESKRTLEITNPILLELQLTQGER